MPGTNPVSGNPIADIQLPSSWTEYLPSSNYTPADVAAKAVSGLGGTPVKQAIASTPGTPWGAPTIYLPDPLRAAVEAATGGRQTVLYDNAGNPSYMYVIPRFNVEDIHTDLGSGVHPAFKNGGADVPYIFIGIVSAANVGGKACAIPGRDPWIGINFDNAKLACTGKGAGWHMMNNWEWAAVALWSLKNGFQPRGNTNNGRAYDATFEVGIRCDGGIPGDSGGTPRTKGGSGPASWRHNNDFSGIADLIGNIWEWQDGFKLVDGQVVMPSDNQFSLNETLWPAQGVYFDSTGTTGTDDVPSLNGAPTISAARTTPSDDCGNGLGVNAPSNDYTALETESGWRALAMVSGYDSLELATRQRMMQAMISAKINSAGTSPFSTRGGAWIRNYGERLLLRGGAWNLTSLSGFGAQNLNNNRTNVNTSIGFRPAYIG